MQIASPTVKALKSPAPVFTRVGPHVRFHLGALAVEATPEGALWIEGERALIVSDLHLEKGASYARRGQMLPPYDTRETLARLSALVARLSPARVIALGDSFHDAHAAASLCPADRAVLRALTARFDWLWILGNHDPAPPEGLGGACAEAVLLRGLTLRHEPRPGDHVEAAGHLHPCARVAGRGRSVRARCFAVSAARVVLPAFGAYAGGLNVRDQAFAPFFPGGCAALVLGRDAVHPAPWRALV